MFSRLLELAACCQRLIVHLPVPKLTLYCYHDVVTRLYIEDSSIGRSVESATIHSLRFLYIRHMLIQTGLSSLLCPFGGKLQSHLITQAQDDGAQRISLSLRLSLPGSGIARDDTPFTSGYDADCHQRTFTLM